jgi:hypothetical protein
MRAVTKKMMMKRKKKMTLILMMNLLRCINRGPASLLPTIPFVRRRTKVPEILSQSLNPLILISELPGLYRKYLEAGHIVSISLPLLFFFIDVLSFS